MSISFDRAADYYDRTRGYPPGVVERIGQALLDAAQATRASRMLELGVGTGRIALPIIRAGYPYTGIDLSPRMLERLRAGLRAIPGAGERVTLVEGDITALPFTDRSFDVVLSVNVFHLVSDRPRAVAEAARVLNRPGVILTGRDEHVGDEQRDPVYDTWRSIARELGWDPQSGHDSASTRTLVEAWRRLGAVVDEAAGVEWEQGRSPAEEVEYLAERLWSRTWSMPDEIAPEVARRLREWAAGHFGNALHTPVSHRRRFVIDRARFP